MFCVIAVKLSGYFSHFYKKRAKYGLSWAHLATTSRKMLLENHIFACGISLKNGTASFPPIADVLTNNSHKQLISTSLTTYHYGEIFTTVLWPMEFLQLPWWLKHIKCTSQPYIFLMVSTNLCFVCSEKGRTWWKGPLELHNEPKLAQQTFLEPYLVPCIVKG